MRFKIRGLEPLPVGPFIMDDVDPETTIRKLRENICIKFNLQTSPDDLILRTGFPPRFLDRSNDDIKILTALMNNDVITVSVTLNSGIVKSDQRYTKRAQKSPPKKSSTPENKFKTLSSLSKSKPSNHAELQHDDDYLKSASDHCNSDFESDLERKKKSKKSPKKRKAANLKLGGFSNKHGNTNDPSASTGDPAKMHKRRRYRNIEKPETTEDIGLKLAAAVSGDGSVASKAFRGALRSAVYVRYDESTAEARVGAALGGMFTINEIDKSNCSNNDHISMIRVTFSKGLRSRSNFEEEVELVETPKLAAIITEISESSDKDMLKPATIALRSPSMFWTLVHLFGGNVILGMKELCPNLNLSHLETRNRQLSVKAIANLKQGIKKIQKTKKIENEESNKQVEVELSQHVDKVEENAHDVEMDLADIEKRIAMLKSEALPTINSLLDNGVLDIFSGNTDNAKLLLTIGVDSLFKLACLDVPAATIVLGIEKEVLNGWVSEAQTTLVDKFMDDIIQDEEIVVVLEQVAKISTPRDLVIMGSVSRFLVETIRQGVDLEEWSTLETRVTCENIELWRTQACKLLTDYNWLSQWVTC